MVLVDDFENGATIKQLKLPRYEISGPLKALLGVRLNPKNSLDTTSAQPSSTNY